MLVDADESISQAPPPAKKGKSVRTEPGSPEGLDEYINLELDETLIVAERTRSAKKPDGHKSLSPASVMPTAPEATAELVSAPFYLQ